MTGLYRLAKELIRDHQCKIVGCNNGWDPMLDQIITSLTVYLMYNLLRGWDRAQ
jgi:hypothetical protein